jgi:hypothetical protein
MEIAGTLCIETYEAGCRDLIQSMVFRHGRGCNPGAAAAQALPAFRTTIRPSSYAANRRGSSSSLPPHRGAVVQRAVQVD